MADLARRLGRLLVTNDSPSDADLIDRFVANRDGPAFAALVCRHGPMVLAVCRRVLRHRQDAEDAFQATFLVLARRADAIRPRSLLGNWLYGVAYRTALGARRSELARRVREAKVAVRVGDAAPDDAVSPDLRAAIDREVAALPAVCRAAVVACDLEGLSRREAAVRLGWSEGTLSSRLARARGLLARQLARYGLAVPAAGLAAVAGPAAVAHTLAEPTVRLATLVAVGEAVVTAPVTALMEGTMRTMLLAKMKAATAAAVVGCAVAVTALAGWRADAAGAADPTQPEPTKAAEAPKRAQPKPDTERRTTPLSDKERIAQLERERDLLLKQLTELTARLDKVEADRKRLEALEAWRMTNPMFNLNSLSPQNFQGYLTDPPTYLGKMTPLITTHPPGSALPTPDKQSGMHFQYQSPPAADPHRPATPAGQQPTAEATPKKPVVKTYDVDSLVRDDKEGEALIKVVRAVVEPKSWGADSGIEYLPGHKVLVVRQTDPVHKEVKELLAELGARNKPAQNLGIRP
ncbi:RNA polymerase sigma factor [Frigoriglobus tundricola]|uniref:Uncharacterized protein n=1 Tax=Frigoriglobus tundricola TaxID=2774151 RepID=A0A6M5YP62_9BACT|nr:RNA polymerase sigma factor [Frigoriglobus tundricola]QJW95768.1 hypothetical protein FTUN_3322 [Frigoriglobus tundricola]